MQRCLNKQKQTIEGSGPGRAEGRQEGQQGGRDRPGAWIDRGGGAGGEGRRGRQKEEESKKMIRIFGLPVCTLITF